jgi:hypothetical protein
MQRLNMTIATRGVTPPFAIEKDALRVWCTAVSAVEHCFAVADD